MPRDIVAHRPGALLGVLNIALGLVLIVGAPARTSSASFMTAREVMPIQLWGAGFLLIGAGCLVATRLGPWRSWPAVLGCGAHLFWAVALLASAIGDRKAALTGIVVYSWVSIVHGLTGVRLSHPARRAG